VRTKLASYGIGNPSEVLSSLRVTPVKDTYIVAIEVTSGDAREAKAAADIVGSVLKAKCSSSGSGGSQLRTIDPAFVRPVQKHTVLRSTFALLVSPSIRTAVGVIAGAACGLMLGLVARRRATQTVTQ
jgi:capsular polysaccharide biosynthesis protein